ncbi:MAG: hypothetical protein ACNYPD_05610 [Candidatus Halichondribacter symbioticus]
MKTIYTLTIALMSGVILTACVGAINIGGVSPESAPISRCIVGNTAQADPTCAKAVADTNGCITNPFSSGCEANPLFSPHVQNARDNRVEFCSDGTNAKNNLCTVVNPCHINPFGTDCFTDAIHDASRKQRISFCGRQTNKDDGICAVALSRPNVASFLQSFDMPLSNATTRNQFVQVTATGLDTGLGSRDISLAGTLNLATGDGDQVLGGDIADGIAFYYYKFPDSSRTPRQAYYSGIFSGTDLGASRTETSGTAEWNGRFSAISGNTFKYRLNTNFTLTINFGVGDQAGNISATICSDCSNRYYSLTGRFDNSGVITGDIKFYDLGRENFGILHGLIGQEGAVGVFIIPQDQIASSAGGFVAVPPE